MICSILCQRKTERKEWTMLSIELIRKRNQLGPQTITDEQPFAGQR